VAGCRSDDDCDGPRAVCEVATGLCQLEARPAGRDAGAPLDPGAG
jgi:hypothetical protein